MDGWSGVWMFETRETRFLPSKLIYPSPPPPPPRARSLPNARTRTNRLAHNWASFGAGGSTMCLSSTIREPKRP